MSVVRFFSQVQSSNNLLAIVYWGWCSLAHNLTDWAAVQNSQLKQNLQRLKLQCCAKLEPIENRMNAGSAELLPNCRPNAGVSENPIIMQPARAGAENLLLSSYYLCCCAVTFVIVIVCIILCITICTFFTGNLQDTALRFIQNHRYSLNHSFLGKRGWKYDKATAPMCVCRQISNTFLNVLFLSTYSSAATMCLYR